jgi:hypothetical protein
MAKRKGPMVSVLAIGDPHDNPTRDKRRFTWMGRHAAQTKPDRIVFIGDTVCLDSLSTHQERGSQDDIDRPAYHEELESADEALSLFHAPIGVGEFRVDHTWGNHEHRACRAAAAHPKTNGDMPVRLEQVFARYRWKNHAFGEYTKIAGVDFVHCPLDIRRREITNETTIKSRQCRSLVMGHTHIAAQLVAVKNGSNEKVQVFNLGTSMPYGERAHYVGTAPAPWDYGVWNLLIQDGRIISWKFFNMLELEHVYA